MHIDDEETICFHEMRISDHIYDNLMKGIILFLA